MVLQYATAKQWPKSMSNFMQRAREYIQAEEKIQIKQAEVGNSALQEGTEQGKKKRNAKGHQRATSSTPRILGGNQEVREPSSYRPATYTWAKS